MLQRAIVMARDGTLDLAGFIGERWNQEVPRQGGRLRPLVDVEGDHIRQVLEGAGWRIEGAAGAAQILGLRPSTLRARMHKLGIQRPAKSSPEPESYPQGAAITTS